MNEDVFDGMTDEQLAYARASIVAAMANILPEQVITDPAAAEAKAKYRRYLAAVVEEIKARKTDVMPIETV